MSGAVGNPREKGAVCDPRDGVTREPDTSVELTEAAGSRHESNNATGSGRGRASASQDSTEKEQEFLESEGDQTIEGDVDPQWTGEVEREDTPVAW